MDGLRMSTLPANYLPALRYSWLTRFYDSLAALTTREKTFKRQLIENADGRSNHTVLDVGYGTGTLAIMMKQTLPGVLLTGVDGDPTILVRARVKAKKVGVGVSFDYGFS